jgi:hypothetical protein
VACDIVERVDKKKQDKEGERVAQRVEGSGNGVLSSCIVRHVFATWLCVLRFIMAFGDPARRMGCCLCEQREEQDTRN